MGLKGSATIELTNADGSKEIVKHDNLITDAVKDLLTSQRGELATIMKMMSNNDSYAQALFGGILLFNDTLGTDATKYALPSNKIVGYASQDAYSGNDLARGSCNTAESGLQEDGSYKLVWDFATSQANGQIKSIGLCPNFMGQVGASETQVDSERKRFALVNSLVPPFNTSGYMLLSGQVDGISTYNMFPVAMSGDVIYAVDTANVAYDNNYKSRYFKNNGNKIKLYKFQSGASSISINNKCGRATYLGSVEVTLPDEFASAIATNGTIAFWYVPETDKLIAFPCAKPANIQQNGTTKYVEITLGDELTTNIYTFTNNTGGAIYSNGYYYNGYNNRQCNLFVCKDYIVTFSNVGTETKMYTVKRSDNTIVKEVKYSETKSFAFSSVNQYFCPFYCHDNILVFTVKTNDYYYIYVLDMETGIVKKTNANSFSANITMAVGNDSVIAAVSEYLGLFYLMNPFVLTTKNNLDTPVTKTASQTMKITYTLTESEG